MNYTYEGVPISPAVFSELALEVFKPRDTVSRREIIERVTTEHERRGGLPASGIVTSTAKRALQNLATDGRVESVRQGYWRFLEPTDPFEVAEPIEVGEGAEAVYVYYFPAYRDQAAFLGRDDWPMKIGMTTSPDISLRVRDQCGTAMPERPIIGLLHRTDDARSAEKMLHSVLAERGRRMVDAPGKEWFLTSLSEVRDVLRFVSGN